MKERGILFSAPMVRALLDGSKSQTRRAMKPQPELRDDESGLHWWPSHACQTMVDVEGGMQDDAGLAASCCPYGDVDERLWVRETFFAFGRWVTQYSEKKQRDEWHFIDMTLECDQAYQYAASNPDVPFAMFRDSVTPQWWKRPAIFMPRAASRILLEITGVRVERLQDISEEDAIAEGLPWRQCTDWMGPGNTQRNFGPKDAYRELWESINGAGSWDANPWVWVIEFKRVQSC